MNPIKEELSTKNITQLPIYRKAIDIFKLNRSIAAYISNNKSVLKLHTSTNPIDRQLNHLIGQGMKLIEHIALAESKDISSRSEHISNVECIVYAMEHHYTILGKSFPRKESRILKVLRSEIESLKQLYWNWAKRSRYHK